MSQSVYEVSGSYLPVYYGHVKTPHGNVLMAETSGRIIHFAFCETIEEELDYFIERWKLSRPVRNDAQCQVISDKIYSKQPDSDIRLLAMGTEFQIKVWQALHQIPHGELRSYSEIADFIDQPSASRAVGTAIGKNPIGLFIPCHRVIRNDGSLGGYRWGLESKQKLLTAEGHSADAFV